jgi:ABC-type transport system involved in multi-copper enzyme maturation permease subunit
MTALILSELRQRIRGKRWWILLIIWVVVLFGLLFAIKHGAEHQMSFSPRGRLRQPPPIGPTMFGGLTLLILGLSCLIIPALTSTSINGERDRGTLAVLQSTLLRPLDIVLAKFLAAMVASSVFLLVTLPLALWCLSEGGVGLLRAVTVYLILLLVLALMVLIGIAASSLVRKPSLSAAAAYGVVFLLTIGSPMLFGLALLSAPQVNYERQVGWRWMILAPDPVVVLADAAPRNQKGGRASESDVLEAIRRGVRDVRRPQIAVRFDRRGRPHDPKTGELIPADVLRPKKAPALWPAGAAIDLLIAAGAFYLAVERLKTPARKLAVGERVA